MPTLQWARVAFEQSTFEGLRRIVIKGNRDGLVPLLNGPGGYMVVEKFSTYDFAIDGPDVIRLTQRPVTNLE
eukprot:3544752-Karenia_brevis.AAC.1